MQNLSGKFKASKLTYVYFYLKCIESKGVDGISFGCNFWLVL